MMQRRDFLSASASVLALLALLTLVLKAAVEKLAHEGGKSAH